MEFDWFRKVINNYLDKVTCRLFIESPMVSTLGAVPIDRVDLKLPIFEAELKACKLGR